MEFVEFKNKLGSIRISDELIADIARDVALSTDGVSKMDSSFVHRIPSVINFEDADGVRVSIRNNEVVIGLYISVKHGKRIPEVALHLQESVKEQILKITGISVEAVHVNVEDIIF